MEPNCGTNIHHMHMNHRAQGRGYWPNLFMLAWPWSTQHFSPSPCAMACCTAGQWAGRGGGAEVWNWRVFVAPARALFRSCHSHPLQQPSLQYWWDVKAPWLCHFLCAQWAWSHITTRYYLSWTLLLDLRMIPAQTCRHFARKHTTALTWAGEQ